jgi:hypothetical protein
MSGACVRSERLSHNGTHHPRVPSDYLRRLYETRVAPIPAGLHLHHACGNPWCVNCDHIIPVTRRQHTDLHRYHNLVAGFDETAFV